MRALPEPLSLPVELESCIHEASAVAVHVTGFPQAPVVFSVIDCPGGSGCKRVAVNDRWVGATCSAQEAGVVGVAVMDVGVGVAAPGAGVAVLVMPVTVPVPVFIPGVATVVMGVPATGEMADVCGFPGHVVETLCGERTMLVPGMEAMSRSGRG